MEEMIEAIDKAIKRLVAPVSMLIAAAILNYSPEGEEPKSNFIVFVVYVLGFSALTFVVCSGCLAWKEIRKSNSKGYISGAVALAFSLVYFILFLTAIRLGFDKVDWVVG
ncbi:hypothetical protein ACOJR9_08900 [Alteromonas sp. A081]|uniref:hypothetical protein n=1 Tax=Alteromonas sp. A081 TaxID=3410269 RepID=UPI003B9814A3